MTLKEYWAKLDMEGPLPNPVLELLYVQNNSSRNKPTENKSHIVISWARDGQSFKLTIPVLFHTP